jgi:hypothetical protein
VLPDKVIPPVAGTRTPELSLQLAPGLNVSSRNQAVVVSPFGFADPLRVADVILRLVAVLVVTTGPEPAVTVTV